MPSSSTARRNAAGVARRLDALLEESVAPTDALDVLVIQGVLSAPAAAGSAQPLSSAVQSALADSGFPRGSVEAVARFVGDCEARGRGRDALKLLGHVEVDTRRPVGRPAFAVIAVEFVLLLLVLVIQTTFVLPQFEAIYEASTTPLPAFTRILLAARPLINIVTPLAVLVLLGLAFPILLRPFRGLLDRLLFGLPGLGDALRRLNGERISGWLGIASPEPASQRAAIEAAQAWYAGEAVSRVCAGLLKRTDHGEDLSSCLMQARGFDQQFRSTMTIPVSEDRLSALRARWRVAEAIPAERSTLAPVFAHIVLGILIALALVAMYEPLFKLGATIVG